MYADVDFFGFIFGLRELVDGGMRLPPELTEVRDCCSGFRSKDRVPVDGVVLPVRVGDVTSSLTGEGTLPIGVVTRVFSFCVTASEVARSPFDLFDEKNEKLCDAGEGEGFRDEASLSAMFGLGEEAIAFMLGARLYSNLVTTGGIVSLKDPEPVLPNVGLLAVRMLFILL